MSRTRNIAAIIVAATFVVFSLSIVGTGTSEDLRATWLAGHFFATGELNQIYSPDTKLFTMKPAESWVQFEATNGYEGNLYPYIYPPLWAALMGWLVPLTSFESLVSIASVVNHILLAWMGYLAWRASGSRLSKESYLLLVLACLWLSVSGLVALLQNQPQILVSLLMVACVERLRAGHFSAAGACLALAAAIKVYPALFAILFFNKDHRRALLSFAVAGSLLAALSILLAGWPLHVQFLHQLSAISNTVLMTSLNFTFDSVIGQLFFFEDWMRVDAASIPAGGPKSGVWRILEKGALWRLISLVGTVLSLAVISRMIGRANANQRYGILWPAAFVIFALFGSISWAYHYLPALAFLPILLDRFGYYFGGVMILTIVAPISFTLVGAYTSINKAYSAHQIIGTCLMLLFAILLLIAAARQPDQRT